MDDVGRSSKLGVGDLRAVDRTRPYQSTESKDSHHQRPYSACWFLVLGVAAVVLSTAFFVPLEINGFSRVLDPAVVQKVNLLMGGGLLT